MFVMAFALFAFIFVPNPAWAVDVSNYAEFNTAAGGTSTNGKNIVVQGTIQYINSNVAVVVLGTGATIRGSKTSNLSTPIKNAATTILANAKATPTQAAADILSAINSAVGTLNTTATGLGLDGFTQSSGVRTKGTTDSVTLQDENKLIDFRSSGKNINFRNLSFSGFNLQYTTNLAIGNINNPISGAGGIVDPLIGGNHGSGDAMSMGTISGNLFDNIQLTMTSTTSNARLYMAGGGIIGIRSTESSATVNTIDGNVFRNLTVKTNAQNPSYETPYIEGGGIVGVNAASSPDVYNGAIGVLDKFNNNLFTVINVESGDVILGSGVVGVNSNNRASSLNINYVRLNEAKNNIFSDVNVKAGYTLRGGGVVGVNALSYSAAHIGDLQYNVFSGVDVQTGTYIRGGGVVGVSMYDIQSQQQGQGPGGSIDFVDNNLFLNINVVSGTRSSQGPGTESNHGGNIMGGGVIGLHTEVGTAALTDVVGNVFRNITVKALTSSGTTNYAGDIDGGGIAGVDSRETGILTFATRNYFDTIAVTAQGRISGGGVLGVNTAWTSQNSNYAALGYVENNTFKTITVSSDIGIWGGGVAGSHTEAEWAITGSLSSNTFDYVTITAGVDGGPIYGGGLAGNANDNGEASMVTVDSNIVRMYVLNGVSHIHGGGVFGVWSGGSNVTGVTIIQNLTNNTIERANIEVKSYISGGGVVGAYGTSLIAAIQNVTGNYIYGVNVTTGTYLDGGGIIGANGKMGKSQGNALVSFDNNFFAGNKITAKEGQILGGIIYTYGLETDNLQISDTLFLENLFTSTVDKTNPIYQSYPNDYAAKVYGTVTIDTGLSRLGGKEIQVTLEASAGEQTGFYENEIVENGVSRTNSLYFGEVAESDTNAATNKITVTNDLVRSDAILNIYPHSKGSVFLLDPIYVDQDDSTTSNYGFQLNVKGDDKTSEFIWDGDNVILTESYKAFNVVSLQDNSNTYLYPGMTLLAVTTDFNLSKNAYLEVWGWDDKINNKFNINKSKLAGTIYFHLDGKYLNDPAHPLMTIIPSDTSTNGRVNIEGATIKLSNFVSTATLKEEDRFYLIDTGTNEYLTGTTATTQQTSVQYISASDQKQYTFIIDKEAADSTATNRYLVARLVDATHVVPDQPIDPPSPSPSYPVPVPTPNPPPSPDPTPTPPQPQPTPTPPFPTPTPQPDPKPTVPDLHIIPEGHAAALAYIAHIGTWLPDHSYQQADFAIKTEDAWQVYYGVDGSYFELDTGAELQLQGATMLLGIAKKNTHDGGSKTLFGLYLEGGRIEYYIDGNFVTTNNVSVTADGVIQSLGVGVLVRHTFKNNFRIEGSFRGGNLENKFRTDNFYLTTGDLVHYDYKVPYLSAHLGAAYLREINDVSRIDFSLRYFWNHIRNKSVDIGGGYMVDFHATNSSKLRGGLRYTKDVDPKYSWYTGAYADYEFAVKSRVTSPGVDYRVPDLQGFTAIVEVGGIGRFKNHDNVSIEFGVQGYLGKFRGLSGGFRIGYEF
jgi:hypothetical protein